MTRLSSPSRNTRGSLALGSAMLILMGFLLVGGVVLLASSAQVMVYQMKVKCAALAGAQTAMNGLESMGSLRPGIVGIDPRGAPVQTQVNDAVSMCLSQMGLPGMSAPTKITVTPTGGDGISTGYNTYAVTVTCSGFNIMSGGILPTILTTPITATAVVASKNMAPPGGAWIHVYGGNANAPCPASNPLTGAAPTFQSTRACFPNPDLSGGVSVPICNGGFGSISPYYARAVPTAQQFELLSETPFGPSLPSSGGVPGFPGFKALQIGF